MKKKTIAGIAGIVVFALLIVAGVLFLLSKNPTDISTANKLDVEWYSEEQKEFVITTAEELYELAALSDFYNFEGQTIKLGADIVINEGSVDAWKENPPAKKWQPKRIVIYPLASFSNF